MFTRYHIKLWLLALVVGALLFSCRKDFDKISTSQWQPELAAPFIQSNITLRNILGSDTNLQVTDDSLLIYYYERDSAIKLTSDSLLQPPDEINYDQVYTLGEIAVSDDLLSDTLMLDTMLDYIDPVIADSLRSFDGETHIFPPYQLEDAINDTFMPSENFEYLTFSQGKIRVNVKNTLPVPVNDLQIKLKDLVYNNDIAVFDIDQLAAGESYQDSVDLAGLTLGNEFMFEITSYSTPGSFPNEVPINLSDGFEFDLMIDNATVIKGRGQVIEQIIVEDSQIIEYTPEAEEELFHIIFNKGKVKYLVHSALTVDAEIEISFPSAEKDGEVPSGEFSLPAGSTVDDDDNVDGMLIDFTTDTTQPYNRFPIDFTITLLPTNEIVDIDSSDHVDIMVNFSDILFAYADGYLGQKEVSIAQDTVETDIEFLENLKGTVIFTEPVITVTYSNSIGVPLKILPIIVGYNSKTGEIQSLDSDSIAVAYPLVPGEVTEGEFKYDNSNSSLVDLLAIRPNNIIYSGGGLTNWDEPGFNFVYDTSVFSGNAEVKIPLILRSSFIAFTDTANFKIDDADNSIKEGYLKANVMNGFPLDMYLTLRVPDSITGEILDTIQFGLISAAPVDASGKVTDPLYSEVQAKFDADFLQNLSRASYALVYVESRTFDNGEVPVGLYSDYVMQTAIGFQVIIQP